MRRNPEDEVKKDASNPTQFGPPVVSPAVTDPQAIRYAQEVQARRGPPKYSAPVAGGPTPAIPNLDAPAASGLSMSDQANIQRAPGMVQQEQVAPPRGGMFQEAPNIPRQPSPVTAPQGPAILPSDILPNEAKDDPEFRQGNGSMYASSQPHLAAKYGVIRANERIPPQKLAQPMAGLSEKTLQGLKAVQEATASRQAAGAEDDRRVTQEAAAGSAGVAGRLGNSPADGPLPDQKARLDEVKKNWDDFDYNTFREAMMKDIINNEEQRSLIEARLKPLDITDIIMLGYVKQRVPIVPEKFEPEFQSMTGEEDLAIKRLIMAESKGLEVTERYLLDKFSFMSIAIGLRSVNNNALPDHRDSQGNFNEELFWKKFERIARLPFHMLASIGVNYFWFDIRVRKLFVAEKLGNG